MADDVREDFPLFPLSLVALPGELVPLHIFEDRYKTMMSQCMEAGTEFGIVWMSDDGLRDVGGAREIERDRGPLGGGRAAAPAALGGRRLHPAGPWHPAVSRDRAPGASAVSGRGDRVHLRQRR